MTSNHPPLRPSEHDLRQQSSTLEERGRAVAPPPAAYRAYAFLGWVFGFAFAAAVAVALLIALDRSSRGAPGLQVYAFVALAAIASGSLAIRWMREWKGGGDGG